VDLDHLFHNVVRALAHLNELGHSLPVVEYRAKVKLHGTNCAIQRAGDGVVAQSRTALALLDADHKGFAGWVHTHRAYFSSLERDLVVFGEWGLVLYPVLVDRAAPSLEQVERLMFKAKGEKHRTAGTRAAVLVDAAVVASIEELAALMVTEARLQQALGEVCGGVRDPRATGSFLAWVVADVRKESVAELEASNLSWAQVEKAVQARARAWFLARKEAV